jgi:hypothetical protein
MPTRSPEMIEQIRGAYERGTLPARTVGALFGLANGEIYALVKAHGWAARSDGDISDRAAHLGLRLVRVRLPRFPVRQHKLARGVVD